jgi:hypothetical protein
MIGYPDARLGMVTPPWEGAEPRLTLTCLDGSKHPKAKESEWPRKVLTGGKLSNNVTQGTAASLLRLAVRKAWDAGLDVRFHVHDEIVCVGDVRRKLKKIMLDAPEWAEGLPLEAKATYGMRYGK